MIPKSLAVKSAGYSGANPNSQVKTSIPGEKLNFKVQTSKNNRFEKEIEKRKEKEKKEKTQP